MRYVIEEIVAHVAEAPVIQIKDGVALIRGRSGGVCVQRSVSLNVLAKFIDRAQRALALYAEGEKSVIVDD